VGKILKYKKNTHKTLLQAEVEFGVEWRVHRAPSSKFRSPRQAV